MVVFFLLIPVLFYIHDLEMQNLYAAIMQKTFHFIL